MYGVLEMNDITIKITLHSAIRQQKIRLHGRFISAIILPVQLHGLFETIQS